MSKNSNMRDGFMVRHDVKVEVTSEVVPTAGATSGIAGVTNADRRLKKLRQTLDSLKTAVACVANEMDALHALQGDGAHPWNRAKELERKLLDKAESERLRAKADQLDPCVETGDAPQNGADE